MRPARAVPVWRRYWDRSPRRCDRECKFRMGRPSNLERSRGAQRNTLRRHRNRRRWRCARAQESHERARLRLRSCPRGVRGPASDRAGEARDRSPHHRASRLVRRGRSLAHRIGQAPERSSPPRAAARLPPALSRDATAPKTRHRGNRELRAANLRSCGFLSRFRKNGSRDYLRQRPCEARIDPSLTTSHIRLEWRGAINRTLIACP